MYVPSILLPYQKTANLTNVSAPKLNYKRHFTCGTQTNHKPQNQTIPGAIEEVKNVHMIL